MVLSLKPVGSLCNMSCAYCYYLEKDNGDSPAEKRMSLSILELAVRQYAESLPPDAPMHFLWHGGEPMLMPLSFYKDAVALQRRYAAGRQIHNSLQTNGTLINREWAEFLASENWLLGVSIDGPESFHDHYRRFRNGGKSFDTLRRTVDILDRTGVQWNAMATVNQANVGHPSEFYDFFKDAGIAYIQFSPVVERRKADGTLAGANEEGLLTSESITARQWGDFLCAVFDRWVREDVGKVFVQIFESTLACGLGAIPGVCIFAPTCGLSPVVEANGDVYCCDHFVFGRFRLGNIRHTELKRLLYSEAMTDFGNRKQAMLPEACRRCGYLPLCNGECPKNRFLTVPEETGRMNYLCEGYKEYFRHVGPFMENARRQILARLKKIQH